MISHFPRSGCKKRQFKELFGLPDRGTRSGSGVWNPRRNYANVHLHNRVNAMEYPLPLLEEVCKRSGLPTYTFVQPAEYNQLKIALRTPGRGVVVEGPSGIGKTTAVRRAAADVGLGDRAQMLSGRNRQDQEIITTLPNMADIGVVVIDDFHRLDDATKHAIADFLKELADREDEGAKVVLIGINRAGDSLVHFAADLNNRIDTIHFEVNNKAKVRELID